MTVNLQGARVLITGATGGLGHAIARSLHAQGAELILTGRRRDVLAPLADELGATSLIGDLASAADVDRLMKEAGTIDVLVANAALPGTGLLEELTVDQIDGNLDVNLRAPVVMTHRVLPAMLERGSGHIVLIGSVSSLTASPGSSMYSATKFGLRGFANGLRQDTHGSGVGVSIVMPGFVRDAGMFVTSEMTLPAGVRTVSPDQVGRAVVRAIEKNKGSVVVAPREMRIGAALASITPELSAWVQRKSGAAEVIAAHQGSRV